MARAEVEERPLKAIAQAFSQLTDQFGSDPKDVKLAPFAHASATVSILFSSLGIAFKFAERDYVAKVQDLIEASKEIPTLQTLIELDIKSDRVKVGGSHARNLLRVKRGLDMVRVLFEGLLDPKEETLKDCASRAYQQVFAPHHSFPIRAAVAAGLYTLPTRTQLLQKLNDDENSARESMNKYVTTVDPMIKYVDGLYLSRGLGIDW